MLNLVTLATFVFIMSLVWLLVRALLKARETPATGPIESMFTPSGVGASVAGSEPWTDGLASQLPQLGSEELGKDLRRAGYYRVNARQRFLALRNGLTLFVVLMTGIIVVMIGPQHRKAVIWTLAAGFAAAMLAFALPRLILAINAKRRVARISAALPDALDTISMCLHGGISLQECMGHVSREMIAVHADLGRELLMVSQQTDINSFEFAIQQFAARIDATEIVALASLVQQNQRLGAGMVKSIRDFADNLRLKRRQAAEAKASRTELFLLFPVIFFLVPSILLILFTPPILSLIDFIQGPTSPLRLRP